MKSFNRNNVKTYFIIFILLIIVVLTCLFSERFTKTTLQDADTPSVNLSRSALPYIKITLKEGNISELHADKSNVLKGGVEIYNSDGTIDCKASIKMHCYGSSSFQYTEDKSYKLKLSNESNILGMSSEKDWTLCSYAFDCSHIRNAIALTMADMLQNKFSPEFCFTDLYINNEYIGLFGLTPDIDKYSEWTTSDNLTLLYALDRPSENNPTRTFVYDKNKVGLLKYPKNPTDEEFDKCVNLIISKTARIEDILAKEESEEKYQLLKEEIDVDSFVNIYIINFISQNIDVNFLSTYYYITSDGILHAGPIWDYDRAFWMNEANPYLVHSNAYVNGLPDYLFFYCDGFRNEVFSKYLSYSGLEKTLYETIDIYSSEIRESLISDLVTNAHASSKNEASTMIDGDISIIKECIHARCNLLLDMATNYNDYLFISITDMKMGHHVWLKAGESMPQNEINSLCQKYGFLTDGEKDIDENYIFENDMVILTQENYP